MLRLNPLKILQCLGACSGVLHFDLTEQLSLIESAGIPSKAGGAGQMLLEFGERRFEESVSAEAMESLKLKEQRSLLLGMASKGSSGVLGTLKNLPPGTPREKLVESSVSLMMRLSPADTILDLESMADGTKKVLRGLSVLCVLMFPLVK